MIKQFEQNSYNIVPFDERADIYVINTCTVTNMSDKKSRQYIRRARKKNKNAIIIATGWYEQVAKDEIKKIEGIDIIIGNNEKNKIIEIIEEYRKNNLPIEQVSDIMKQTDFLDLGILTREDKTRAVIKIQDGCDKYCTYCIIPFARGRVRSRNEDSIIAEAKALVASGVKEIVITGIHIASYGKDLKDTNLCSLLIKLNKIEGLSRIRLGSLEPTILTNEFVNKIKNLKKLCNHFHLSLQSGCNETLKRMNRHYTVEEFKNVVERLRKAFPEVMLTTDIIVGFPGETEEEFKKTYYYLKNIKFYKMHVFPYSKREGTKASKMQKQISQVVKEQRSKKLIELSNENEKEYLKKYIGKNLDVLFEKKEGEFIKGHTSNYLEVKVENKQTKENEIKTVHIIKREKMELIGEIVTKL